MFEQCRDEQSTNAAVSVEERMNRLELRVDESDHDQWRQRGRLGMNETFEVAEQLRDLLGRWGDENGIAGTGAADPILGSP